MLKRLDPVLKKRAEDVVFIEMKAGVPLEWNGYEMPDGTPLPIRLQEIVGDIRDNRLEQFSSVTLAEGMILMLGIDSQQPHREVYTEALKAYQPDMLQVILAKGLAAASEDRFEDALLLFRAALQLDPEDPDALYNYGRVLVDLAGKHEGTRLETAMNEEALEVFETLCELRPELPQPCYHLGFLYANKKAFIRAADIWKRALSMELTEDQELEIRTRLIELEDKRTYEEGYTAVLKGYNQEALELLCPLEEKYPEWWNLFFFIGLAYKGMEQYADAVSCFLRVAELNPVHAETRNELGICYLMLRHYDEAAEQLSQGISQDPESAELLCNMGIVQLEKGRPELAEKFFTEALKKAPDDEICKAWLEKVRNELQLKGPMAERLN